MYRIKVVNKIGVPRDSKNPKIFNYCSDDLEKTISFVEGLNTSDPVFWRNRYRILQFLEDDKYIII